ncbi:hypothetical protein [Paenibacillus jilunlii]|uniref:Uncharacterized protein n=1 Tax=Paenibacillus jilunlii TaxID=682956 RepID=A0ABR5T0G1_9BACL|nr:hypothetical protein [Paenibacillus jilunlii]KWX79617.1 hypothetical protein AML91_02410 [Paenibacillus jilunlii]
MNRLKSKYFYSMLAIVILLGGAVYFSENVGLTGAEPSLSNSTTGSKATSKDVVTYHGDLAVNYNTVTELTYDSESINEIKVAEKKSFEYKGVVFTVSKANIAKTYKGDLEGSVNILETGGNYNNTEYLFDDASVLKPGDKAVVYLKKYEGPIIEAQGAYVISGVYQGKFNIDEARDILVPAAEEQQELTEVKSLSDLNLE